MSNQSPNDKRAADLTEAAEIHTLRYADQIFPISHEREILAAILVAQLGLFIKF